MRKRRRMTRKQSKRSYKRGSKTSKKNLRSRPMRGGWRL